MFRIQFGNNNNEGFEGNDNFRYFKPDLALKGLRLQTEAKFENRLFYENTKNN